MLIPRGLAACFVVDVSAGQGFGGRIPIWLRSTDVGCGCVSVLNNLLTATWSLGLLLSALLAQRELEHGFRNGAEERFRILLKEVVAVLEHSLDVQ